MTAATKSKCQPYRSVIEIIKIKWGDRHSVHLGYATAQACAILVQLYIDSRRRAPLQLSTYAIVNLCNCQLMQLSIYILCSRADLPNYWFVVALRQMP
jgi:hypothetical protein